MLASLPFKLETSEKIWWFNYDVDGDDTIVNIDVVELFAADDDLNVEKWDIAIHIDIPVCECKKEELDIPAYMQELADKYPNIKDSDMNALLQRAVLLPMMGVYSLVINYINDTSK